VKLEEGTLLCLSSLRLGKSFAVGQGGELKRFAIIHPRVIGRMEIRPAKLIAVVKKRRPDAEARGLF
jgi:hypothetical protein